MEILNVNSSQITLSTPKSLFRHVTYHAPPLEEVGIVDLLSEPSIYIRSGNQKYISNFYLIYHRRLTISNSGSPTYMECQMFARCMLRYRNQPLRRNPTGPLPPPLSLYAPALSILSSKRRLFLGEVARGCAHAPPHSGEARYALFPNVNRNDIWLMRLIPFEMPSNYLTKGSYL